MTKTRKNLKYYLIAVICVTAFFVHESFEKNSAELIQALQNHKEAKSQRTKALNIIKDIAKDTPEYQDYIDQKKITDKAYKNYQKIESKEHFLGFDNFKQFMGEFGWASGVFIYAMFNLCIAWIRRNESMYGEIILHGVLIFISIYFINWALFRFEDYSRFRYLSYSLLMASIIVFASHLLIRSKTKYMDHIERSLKMMFKFLYRDAEERQLVNPDKRKDFRKTRLELTNKIVGDE